MQLAGRVKGREGGGSGGKGVGPGMPAVYAVAWSRMRSAPPTSPPRAAPLRNAALDRADPAVWARSREQETVSGLQVMATYGAVRARCPR